MDTGSRDTYGANMDLVIGILAGAACLIAFWRSSNEALAQAGFVALVAMLSVYIGAHLVSSDLMRILAETGFATVIAAIALYVRDRSPVWIGALILGHGAYDYSIGHGAGVADWYPLLCAGFDVTVGLGLIYRLSRKATAKS